MYINILLFLFAILVLFYYYEGYNNLISDEILKGNFITFKNKSNVASFNQQF